MMDWTTIVVSAIGGGGLLTGAHDAYNKGDKVTFEGDHYISLIDGNVWSPAAYPAGWEKQA